MNEQLELRVLDSDISVNEEDMVVEGLVNQTGAWSHELGRRKKFVEKIEKGAFTRAIEENPRIDFLGEHRTDMLLATTENGSLKLWEDDEGLKMRAKIAPTSYGKDLFTLMKNKMVNHMSFGFKVLSDKWEKRNDGVFCRSVDKLALKEVSVVRNPAYPQSAIAARGIDVVEDVEIPTDLEQRNEEKTTTESVQEVKEMFNEFKTEIINILTKNNQPNDSEEKTETKTVEEPKNDSEKIVETQTEPVKTEPTQENKVEEVKTEKVEETETKPVEENNSKEVVDLLAKYKKLQSLKKIGGK